MSAYIPNSLQSGLSAGEHELVRELVRALRSIRYGSVVLTVHEGRVVEIHKTEKIRTGGLKLKD